MHDGVEYTLPSPNGMVFQSVAALHRAHVRSERKIYEGGVEIGVEKELCAEFGDMDSPEIRDESAGESYYAIRGHFINTLEQGKKKGWTDDERRLVEKKLLLTQDPADYWLHTKPPAGKPWPKYDEIPAARIAELASDFGVVPEALAYERENKNRKTVLEGLAALLAQPEATEEELAAV